MNAQDTSAEPMTDLPLEIAHLLLIDVVGYSKLLVNEQIELLQELNQIVRGTECFRAAETKGKLIRVPTGDGMALLFFHSPEEPARCALEISRTLQGHPHIQLRMGVHSGPVNQVTDVNDKTNIAGAGINVAQRVMDCGDAGHILLSWHIAEDLTHYRHWQPYLHDLGECEVKHGLRLPWLISTKTISATQIFQTNSSEEEDGSGRPLLATVRSVPPLGPSTCLPLFCSFRLWLWRPAFQSFTDEARRGLHAPLRGNPPTQDFLFRKRVSLCFPLRT